jgi:hypothetical protein
MINYNINNSFHFSLTPAWERPAIQTAIAIQIVILLAIRIVILPAILIVILPVIRNATWLAIQIRSVPAIWILIAPANRWPIWSLIWIVWSRPRILIPIGSVELPVIPISTLTDLSFVIRILRRKVILLG